MKKSTPKTKPTITEVISNSLSGLSAFFGQANQYQQQVSLTDTIQLNLRYNLISNDRQLLSQAYVEHGILQTLVDQPVDDAFRAGFEIQTDQLSPEELETLEVYVERNKVIMELAQALKWARLYGGGAVVLINGDDPLTPLTIDKIKEGSPMQFRAVDMWELYRTDPLIQGDTKLEEEPEFYSYYGKQIHHSRVYPCYGKRPPSFIRARLLGWGMSEVERVVRSFNSYLKNQDVIFELLDEAKVDVYKMKGFNASLLTSGGTTNVANRIQNANMIKNFQNAITMDVDDEYEQKQVSFTGLNDIMLQIRQGIAADLKMPMTKLFGISSAGFSSGEDDIENYNAMIEGEIRSKCKYVVVDLLQLCCQVLFGFVPDDLKIKFHPLKILSAKEEEEVKNFQFNRVMSSYQSGLIPDVEAKQALNKANLLPLEVNENLPASEPLGGDYATAPEGNAVE